MELRIKVVPNDGPGKPFLASIERGKDSLWVSDAESEKVALKLAAVVLMDMAEKGELS